MGDFINKVLTLILVFILLILAPLTIEYTSERHSDKLHILNEMVSFTDKICDKKSITNYDMEQLYGNINCYGMNMDAEVIIEAPVEENGQTYFIVLYNLSDITDSAVKDLVNTPIDTLRSGYKMTVKVKEVAKSPISRAIEFAIGYDGGLYTETYSSYIGR